MAIKFRSDENAYTVAVSHNASDIGLLEPGKRYVLTHLKKTSQFDPPSDDGIIRVTRLYEMIEVNNDHIIVDARIRHNEMYDGKVDKIPLKEGGHIIPRRINARQVVEFEESKPKSFREMVIDARIE